MDVHRFGIKLFAADPASVRLEDFILLIDVHDYSHMQEGPGILLVAHEGNFSIDMGGGRPGLLYYRKIPTTLSPGEHLATILRSAIEAVRLLERDARVQFNLDEVLVLANDRLNAPNTDASFAELKPSLAAALQKVFEASFDLARTTTDPKERFAVTCRKM